MRLVLFFGVIFISLVVSVLLGDFQMKRTNTLWIPFLIACLSNLVILGSGSIWWFLTETDGISQGLGVLYYGIAIVIIVILNLIMLLVMKGRYENS